MGDCEREVGEEQGGSDELGEEDDARREREKAIQRKPGKENFRTEGVSGIEEQEAGFGQWMIVKDRRKQSTGKWKWKEKEEKSGGTRVREGREAIGPEIWCDKRPSDDRGKPETSGARKEQGKLRVTEGISSLSPGSPGNLNALNEDGVGLEPMRVTQALQELEVARSTLPEATETEQSDSPQIKVSLPNPNQKTSIEHSREGEGKKRPPKGKSNALATGGAGLGRIRKASVRKPKFMGTRRKVGEPRKQHTTSRMEASDVGTTLGRKDARIIIDLTQRRKESMELAKGNEHGEKESKMQWEGRSQCKAFVAEYGEAGEDANGAVAAMDTQRDTSMSHQQGTMEIGNLPSGPCSDTPFQYIYYDAT